MDDSSFCSYDGQKTGIQEAHVCTLDSFGCGGTKLGWGVSREQSQHIHSGLFPIGLPAKTVPVLRSCSVVHAICVNASCQKNQFSSWGVPPITRADSVTMCAMSVVTQQCPAKADERSITFSQSSP
ncbi:hypothetical protein H257_17644 [Aphanomyces astaci]|uniref:Uncharacterized protein n=1 Tax=Aphanomyces astaci TaxID=112090 RepID=W4FDX9_APHAT|nr:hypothetical protein H257_17644 [Aphanomyces astaci]ETV65702.1 hypothetical protein H257_17644 [Aphanomyces astaci]|eukprot:XP_009844809.1 hypothetical protein H257_17644 [Aphanomyces astaci]